MVCKIESLSSLGGGLWSVSMKTDNVDRILVLSDDVYQVRSKTKQESSRNVIIIFKRKIKKKGLEL